jgi:hypothetical protein
MVLLWIAAILIVIAGFHTVATVGVTGGPNHGEHPFTVTLVHMIVFAFLGRHWPVLSRHMYWGGLAVALVLSIIALRLTFNENRAWRVLIRIPLGLLYVGLLVVLFKRP